MPGKHHLFGPSSLERRALCPASARLEEGLPETESPYAAEGTMLHSVVAYWMSRRSMQELPPDVPELSVEQLEACRRCYEFAECVIPEKAAIHIEQSINLRNWSEELLTGTPDIVADDGESLIVIDWKFGRNPVAPASENHQGAGYAAMSMQTYKRKRATVYFYQPRILHYGESPNSYTFTDCPAIVSNIRDIIAKCNEPAAPAVSGERQCKYCRAKDHGICPAVSPMIPALADRAQLKSKGFDAMTPEQLAGMWETWKIAQKVGESLEYYIKKTCREHGRCGNLRLKTKQGNRQCEKPEELFAMLDAVELVTAEEFMKNCKVSISNLELLTAKKLKDRGECDTLKDGKIQFSALVSHLITRGAESEVIVAEVER